MLDSLAGLPLHEKIWLGVGLFGQLCFASRFVVQWISSELKRRSHVPEAFWYLSLAGGLILLSYAIHRRDPVFILGQSMGAVIYVRNIVLIHDEKRRARTGPTAEERP
ncbi:lipid A biosynthesis protein [bacterium]|nr:lipid A biosynthesis protein [bacterium]